LTTKKLEHMGIKAQLLGQLDTASERGVKHEFMSMGEIIARSETCTVCTPRLTEFSKQKAAYLSKSTIYHRSRALWKLVCD